MRILWAKLDFLHPTTKGGHIRTLEMLKRLHRRHEIHYVAIEDPRSSEGVERSVEYSSFRYPVRHRVPPRFSPGFFVQVAAGLVDPMPVAVGRFRSTAMRSRIAELLATGSFDRLVCDFLAAAPNIPDISRALLFEHNVEAMIWKRHAESAPDPVRRAYFGLQARRMRQYERETCRRAGYVAAVSEVDAALIRREFGVSRVGDVPTGVDTEYFAPPEGTAPDADAAGDLVFVGSMDWMPNYDGVAWFLRDIFPLLAARRPGLKINIVGRNPAPALVSLAASRAGVRLTGTVADVRPYLWNGAVSIVPLRAGSGTRLKIYEAMAARCPVVSTSVGAEGLPVEHGRHLLLANDPASFADACLALLDSAPRRQRLAKDAFDFVAAHFSWESVARKFESLLEEAPRASDPKS